MKLVQNFQSSPQLVRCHISFNIFHIPVLIYHRDDSFHLGLISVRVDNQKLFTISRFWDCKGFWEMRLYVKRKPRGAETEILQDNYVNTMAADVPVPCAAKHQRHWYLTKQGEVIFHEEKINYLCLLTFEDDKNANTFIFPYINSVVHLTSGVL